MIFSFLKWYSTFDYKENKRFSWVTDLWNVKRPWFEKGKLNQIASGVWLYKNICIYVYLQINILVFMKSFLQLCHWKGRQNSVMLIECLRAGFKDSWFCGSKDDLPVDFVPVIKKNCSYFMLLRFRGCSTNVTRTILFILFSVFINLLSSMTCQIPLLIRNL